MMIKSSTTIFMTFFQFQIDLGNTSYLSNKKNKLRGFQKRNVKAPQPVALIPGQQHVKSTLEKEADKVCNFINIFRTFLLYENSFRQLLLCTRNIHVTRKKAAKTTSCEKNARKTLMKLTQGLQFHHVIQKCF